MSMVCRSHARLIGRTPIRHAFRTAVMRILVTRARQARMVSVDCVEVADVVDGVLPASAAMASCVLDATQIATMATTSDFLRIGLLRGDIATPRKHRLRPAGPGGRDTSERSRR